MIIIFSIILKILQNFKLTIDKSSTMCNLKFAIRRMQQIIASSVAPLVAQFNRNPLKCKYEAPFVFGLNFFYYDPQ